MNKENTDNANANRHFFRASAADFKKIPGIPIAYWVNEPIIDVFQASNSLSNYADIGKGLDTGDNNRFLRCWYEVPINSRKWIPCQKGGAYRKWFGNNDFVINWANDGEELKKFSGSNLRNVHNYFKEGLTWTRVSSNNTAFRFFPEGQIFESTGPCLFLKKLPFFGIAGFLNSKLSTELLKFMAPTLDFQSGHISALPILQINWEDARFSKQIENCINLSRADWDAYETSWDFTILPLLNPDNRQPTLKATYQKLRAHWREMTLEMQRLEEENNRIFIDAYGLQDELKPEVPLNEITLTCNPHYRYGNDKSEDELEALLLADTMRELVSYAVGCMFGRYALDKPGLILANQGETLSDYLKRVPEPTFPADDDNVIPMLDDEWFEDDIVGRFKEFIKVAYGKGTYAENLSFLEQALAKDIRKYFVKDFYKDHIKRYKKRPIYWMFSSPKGHFNTLIYLHRYTPDTLNVMLNNYLRPFIQKLEYKKEDLARVIQTGTTAEKNKALRETDRIEEMLQDCKYYEREILFPLASERIEIDLDDGVLVNYNFFGDAVQEFPGLNDNKTKAKVREFDWIDSTKVRG